ncbi:hypothetical protein M5D96_005839 [Drosophila gunungcola]|uniref:Gamma-tubulin complex component n=2 Tax=Drosophila gunungcola TaxID=103775 RepID=A0A9P9YR20_9MUSC|nr:hypothetical protein M5D96_005839 [Drosophila gunungcola]
MTQSARSLVSSERTGRLWDAESELSLDNASMKSLPSLELTDSQKAHEPSTNEKHKFNKIQVKENFATNEAKMELALNLIQLESSAAKPTKADLFKGSNDLLSRIQTPWWQVDIHVYPQPRILASSFSLEYGNWLLYQLRESRFSVRKTSEEQQLLRELIILFIATVDFDYFEILDNELELRRDRPHTCALSQLMEGPVLPPILSSLKEMRHLRQLIEVHTKKRITGDRLETLTSFSVALRRLLRPVMEFLVYFERRLTRGIETPTLQHFLETSSAHLERIQLLYELSKSSIEGEPSLRSLHIVESLLTYTYKISPSKMQRNLSAALLLHSLQAYCQFLDNWWSTGEFTDWHEEFPYQRLLIDGRTEYGRRKIELPEENLFQIIQRHFNESREALAILYDTRKIGDFNCLHGNISQTCLHNSLLDSVLKELTPYQTERLEESGHAPDILEQLRFIDQEPVRRMFYSFHMETRPDPQQPADCSVDQLLRNFQASADYAPISEIICHELRRLLHRRSLLANSYVSDLVKKSEVDKIVRHLQSVFLLLKYDLCRSEFELFFDLLERNLLTMASNQLKEILVSQDPRFGYLFHISITGPHPDLIYLKVSYEPLLNRVISQEKIEHLNHYFRLNLNLHFSLYQLRNLPVLNIIKPKRLVQALQSLRTLIATALENQLSHLAKLHQPEGFTTLCELRQNHDMFMLQTEEKLRVEFEGGQYPFRLEDILSLSRVLRYRWLRAWTLINDYSRQKSTCICEAKYEWLRFDYLQTTFKHCKAIGCFLGQK